MPAQNRSTGNQKARSTSSKADQSPEAKIPNEEMEMPHWWLGAQSPDLDGIERRRQSIESRIGRKLEDHECRPVWWSRYRRAGETSKPR